MAPPRHKEKQRQSLSLPGRGQRSEEKLHLKTSSRSEEKLHLKTGSRSRETRRQSSLPPNTSDTNTATSSSDSLKPPAKVRTISVPAGLKEILNDLSKEVTIVFVMHCIVIYFLLR